jgi:hypothetical protein
MIFTISVYWAFNFSCPVKISFVFYDYLYIFYNNYCHDVVVLVNKKLQHFSLLK